MGDTWLRGARIVAWAALAGVTGVFVHAEAFRPDLPDGVVLYKDIIYRRDVGRRAKLDVYVPSAGSTTRRPAIVAIHGGGWHGGTKNGYGREIARLAPRGFVVVSVDYVLSRPGHPSWPENLEDVREAVRWIRRNAEQFGVDPDRIAAIGSSAGGHLATMLGTNAGGVDLESRVAAVVDLYGPTDLTSLGASPGAVEPLRLHLGATAIERPDLYIAASPIAHASPGDAPTLLIHGEADVLVPFSQSTLLAERLRASGVEAEVVVVPGVGHAFRLDMPEHDLIPRIVDFLERAWSHQTGNSLYRSATSSTQPGSP